MNEVTDETSEKASGATAVSRPSGTSLRATSSFSRFETDSRGSRSLANVARDTLQRDRQIRG